jgi:hypothetical protein
MYERMNDSKLQENQCPAMTAGKKEREKKVYTRVWKVLRVWVGLLDDWFLTKFFFKIHSTKESIKIYLFLNTKGQFKSLEKSQLNTNRFCYPEKKILIVLIEFPQDLFIFY